MLPARLLATGIFCAAVAFVPSIDAFAQTDLRHWYFAEGSTNTAPGLAFEEEILIGNPGGAPANVTLRFLPPNGIGGVTASIVVSPYARQGINVRQFVPRGDAALEIVSDVDIVVERSMYWGQGLFNFPGYNPGLVTDMRGGHNVLGVNAPRTRWMFAEGAIGGPVQFQTFVLVSNPSASDSAQVLVHFLTSLGERLTESLTLPPGSRETVWANDAIPRHVGARERVEFAIDVESVNGVPVVVERAMYWGANRHGGHAAVGSQASSVWYFAEGVQGAPPFDFETYVLLYNPSTTEAIDVSVEFFNAMGLARTVVESIPPQSRRNVYAGLYPNELSGADKAFAIRATNAQGRGFVAERAIYWRGMREGTASAGVTALAHRWGFADGQEGGFAQYQDPADANRRHFSTYYLVLNPSDQPVDVRAVFYVEPQGGEAPGAGAETRITVPARSRATVSTSEFAALQNRKFAAFFEAAAPVIIERAMYWGQGIGGGHASAGAVLPDTLPTLASPTPPAGPAIFSIAPARGAPAGGTLATITGSGFGLLNWSGGETSVAFGVTPVPQQNITVVNGNTIQVVTPPSGRGLSNVLVTTRGVPVELVGAFHFVDPFEATGAPFGSAPNRFGNVAAVAARNPFAMFNSCRNHDFMFEVVAELRRRDGTNRWGLNWKRGVIGDFSHDIVNYYFGPEGTNMRNSTQVWIFDIIGGHCGPGPSPFWQDQTGATRAAGTVGRWTTEPMCSIPRYRDAKFDNGEWMFPECR